MTDQSTGAISQNAQKLGVSGDLLAILVCPVDHAALAVVEQGLRCTTCDRIYPVHDGIPSMVPDSPSA